ncbi:TRAP transporter permease [Sphaerochaeta globosa]|uniref:TRAP transporter, 4TM/12TM fusion protein n=1 Tax=Sphaerochaeta globosa (strain ATCC BAA-1886 / DSM 22777 / Buddy) TaxID=158189 RepID=F0RWS5_SPHGB|nr:TRAP transporter permease [Sphaerochaeta globosa]ADY13706.1 TRAP transporter, 4TM/12TM fusion protein [Sphaerochaeta globosa str. Buddy]
MESSSTEKTFTKEELIAQELLDKKESDSKLRVYSGPLGTAITALFLIWSVFQVYANTIGIIDAMSLRTWHLFFLMLFTFLLFPTYPSEKRKRALPPIWDMVLLAVLGFTFLYLLKNYILVAKRGGYLLNPDLWIAGITMLLIFEAGRRACKNLAILGLIFLLYNFLGMWIPGELGHVGFSVKRVLNHMIWGSQGIFGVGIGVSATYIFLFVLFGAYLKYSGFSQFINDISLTLVGRSAGGPAKVAVIASALLGMINGSAIANVATTGTITIPMMKKTGYKKEFAAAVEAVASTGGQFAPPIMGAVGFVMAEFLGVSYTKVMVAAAIPAFLYYLSLLFAVHFEAKRLGLSGLSKENIPNAVVVLKKQGHLLIPLFVLIGMLGFGFTPLFAAVIAIFATVGASWLRKETRMTWSVIVKATVEGARSAVAVGMSCAIIGVIIGTVSLTGIGLSFGYIILKIVGEGQLYLGGLMVMLMSIVLGMGVPGVAAYVIVSTVSVPVLIQTGAIPMAAHMFCLIYACLSNITPPVAMSSYVASGIADSDQTKTSLIAVKLGLTGFILPFFFLNNPILLLGSTEGIPLLVTLRALLTSSIGVIALSSGLQGYLFNKLNTIERLLMVVAGLLFIETGLVTDLAGLFLVVIIIAIQYKNIKSQPKERIV